MLNYILGLNINTQYSLYEKGLRTYFLFNKMKASLHVERYDREGNS